MIVDLSRPLARLSASGVMPGLSSMSDSTANQPGRRPGMPVCRLKCAERGRLRQPQVKADVVSSNPSRTGSSPVGAAGSALRPLLET